MESKGGSAVTIAQIKSAVAEHFHLDMSDLDSPRRFPNLVYARHLAMWICRESCKTCGGKHTFESIGKAFNHNHAAVQNAVKMINNRLDTIGKPVRADIEAIRSTLKETHEIETNITRDSNTTGSSTAPAVDKGTGG